MVGVENEAALGQTLDVLACRRTPHLAKVLTLTQSPAKCPRHPNLGEGSQHWLGGGPAGSEDWVASQYDG